MTEPGADAWPQRGGVRVGRPYFWLLVAAFLMAIFLVLPPLDSVQAQVTPLGPGAGTVEQTGPAALPDALTPEIIDGLMARLTDADIRALLRDELVRRAEEQAAADAAGDDTLAAAAARLEIMAATIETRMVRWAGALANIGERRERIEDRMSLAESGVVGIVLAALAVVAAGCATAFLLSRLTSSWRHKLMQAEEGYWEKVGRSLALTVLELLPIVGFVVATLVVSPAVGVWLGPLLDYVWIYHAGISYGWAFIVLARRIFAPDAPAVRIAALSDQAALGVYCLVHRSVILGMAGWLLAGLAPTLGLGFPPAMILMALAGTAVAALLFFAVLRNRAAIVRATGALLAPKEEGEQASTLGALMAAAGPSVLAAYVLLAWLYWLGHWLERGAQRLEGPAGTLVVLLLLPLVDRLGQEGINSIVRIRTEASARYRQVFCGAWRSLVVIFAVFLVADFWGLNLLALAKGPDAAPWAGMLFDVIITLLIGQLIWRLIKAALYSEKPAVGGDEGDEEHEVAPSSRLDTLLPLFRNMLLGILVIVVAMIALSSIGVDIGPLLASAGIIGIAIGFGAQTLVRDIFSGAFFLIDDAFRVGEYIELEGDLRGEVEAISIRSLQLRHHRGPVITIPFGELKSITNHNRDWVIYKMNFRMEPETDPQKVKKIVKEVGKELWANPEHGPKFIEPLKSQGVYMIDDDSALVIRVKFMCKPRAQFVLRREIYHRLREVFAERGVKLARRKVEVVSGDKDLDETTLKGAVPEEPAKGGAST